MIKNLPYKNHDYSFIAHEASLAALDQGKYWEMHDLLLARSPKLDRTSLVVYAAELKLDVKRFGSDLDTMRHQADIDRDLALALSLDLYSTPTFFINGRKVVGNRDFEYLKVVVEEELSHAGP